MDEKKREPRAYEILTSRNSLQFLKFLKQHSISLSDINQQIIDDFIDSVSLKVHQNTVRRIIIALRNFLKFLYERMGIHVHYTLPIPKEIKRIPVVLSEEEIINIVLSIDNPKFQLLFALYYETGARRTELLSVKLKHIRLHENYAEIAIPQSKSIPRVVPVVLFYPLLARFLETHPGKDNLEAYLFYSNRNYLRPMSQTTVWNFFDEISHKYRKRITPHVLRHSRGTHLAKMGMMEKEIMIILGQSTRRMRRIRTSSRTRCKSKTVITIRSGRGRENNANQVSKMQSHKPKRCPILYPLRPPTKH